MDAQGDAAERPDDGRSVPERIADRLDYEMTAGAIERGERLIEVSLARRFGVGRSSIREALRLLERRGSVEISPHRGAVAHGHTLERMADAFAVSAFVNALAARLFAAHRDADALAHAELRLREVEALRDPASAEPSAFGTAVARFYAAIVKGSGSRYIRNQVSSVMNRSVSRAIWDVAFDFLDGERRDAVVALLRRTLERIAAGDADGAEHDVRAFNQGYRAAALRSMADRTGAPEPRVQTLVAEGMGSACMDGQPSLSARVAALERRQARLAARIGDVD